MRAAPRRQPQRELLRSLTFPAPVGGINTVSPGLAIPLTDCVYAYNMIAAEYGLRSRLGSREWCTRVDPVDPDLEAPGQEIRTLLSFTASTLTGNRLFATTATGIWDVSSSSNSPTYVLAFASSTGPSGWGISCAVVNAAGTHFLLYCDEVNGYHVYNESTNTWAAVTMGAGGDQISGVDPSRFVFVMVWQSRVWFVERDTAASWYLDVNAIYGAATKFNFGMQFRAGGHLVGLWSWTGPDGGKGVNDRLVAISAGGDVAIYQGTDPSSASTFGITATWFVGAVPAGRRIATNTGGEMLILSTIGVLPLSRLTTGTAAAELGQYATAKIANLFNVLSGAYRSIRGWSIVVHPEDNALLVLIPTGEGQATIQLAMSFATKGWFQYRDLPMSCAEAWGGKLYFGTPDGRVLVNEGYVDGVTLTDPNSYTPVQWSILTAFSGFGSAAQKQVHLIRPLIRSEGAVPSYCAAARYDWNVAELAAVTDPPPAAGDDAWDTALWDTAVWGGSNLVSNRAGGAVGIGTSVAIALRGTAKARTTLVSVDVAFEQGGLL